MKTQRISVSTTSRRHKYSIVWCVRACASVSAFVMFHFYKENAWHKRKIFAVMWENCEWSGKIEYDKNRYCSSLHLCFVALLLRNAFDGLSLFLALFFFLFRVFAPLVSFHFYVHSLFSWSILNASAVFLSHFFVLRFRNGRSVSLSNFS